MKSNISPLYYHSEPIYRKEIEAIFKKGWQFVGFRSQLQNHNDFVTRIIGGVPIVVQNLKGDIKAFLNVCSHRFSIIQQEPFGNRALVCPYHGWSYNNEGMPTGIPKKPMFKDFTAEELNQMCLKNFPVEFCGDLCFAAVGHDGVNLKEYLGEFYSELQDISISLGEMIDVNRMEINANWKIIVENTLESYHVNLIHSETFRKLGASGIKFNFASMHSNWDAELKVKRYDDSNKKIEDLFAPRKYYLDGYKHYLIFPNLLISSTYGTSYNFSLVEPAGPDKTVFTSYVFIAQVNETAKRSLLSAYKSMLSDFNRDVFKEDKGICELVQKGVYHTELQGVLSLEEERVHSFQNWYIKLIEYERQN